MRKEEIARAIRLKTPALEIDGVLVQLPAPQTSGTEHQKLIYSHMKAEEVITKLEKL